MALCKNCGEKIDWAICDDRWVPLEPIDKPLSDVEYAYVDDDGVVRADHRDRCSRVVRVTRLKHKMKAQEGGTNE